MKLATRELVSLSLIAAITVAGKEAMSFLPNIEPVTLLLMSTALVYGWKAMYPCYVFVLIEGLLYGFGWWFYCYLYIWGLLVAAVVLLRRFDLSWTVWVIIAALFGLFFGTLCCIESLIVGGWSLAFSFWVAGFPYDLIHCAGNAVVCGVLLKPLTTLLRRLAAPGASHANKEETQ